MKPFNDLADEIDYDIVLIFLYTNVHGAEIYRDWRTTIPLLSRNG